MTPYREPSGEEAALLRAVCSAPEDDTVRLAYADYVSEQGNEARGEFIRAQIRAANGDSIFDMHLWDLLRESAVWFVAANKLTRTDPTSWGVQLDGTVEFVHEDHANTFSVRRGFVERITVTERTFLGGPCGCGNDRPGIRTRYVCSYCDGTGVTEAVVKELFKYNPVTKVVLTDKEPAPGAGGTVSWSPPPYYTTSYERANPHSLHIYLWNRIFRIDYKDRGAAMAELSRACVSYGKYLVGPE